MKKTTLPKPMCIMILRRDQSRRMVKYDVARRYERWFGHRCFARYERR